jgi:hypothetical protein
MALESKMAMSVLWDAITGEQIGAILVPQISTLPFCNSSRDHGSVMRYDFQQRGKYQKNCAVFENAKQNFMRSHCTGATRADSWVDIDVVLELVCNASLCKLFPDQSYVKEIH